MQTVVRTSSGLEVALAVWHRRKWLASLVFLVPFSAFAGATRTLPAVYESTATVLVEHQLIPERLAGPSAADELETRLRSVSQQILSRSRLYALITQFDLYPEQRAQMTPEMVAERMRRDIEIDFNAVRDTSGRDATIAFSLNYRGRDPEVVAQVTNALAALFVEENTRMREQQTAGTTAFLEAQLADAKRQLEVEEQRMGQFKDRYLGELPEQQATNLAALERLNTQLRVISDRELRAIERRNDLTKQLAESPGGGAADSPAARLGKLRLELADLRTRYTDEHPEVVRVRDEIAALQRQLAAGGGNPTPTPASSAPDIQNNLAEVDKELATLRSQEQTLQRAIASYEQRGEKAPRREQELQQISRDYNTSKELYQSLLQRYEDAQLAERMQQRLQGDQFRVLDPAVPSRQPVAPHRIRLLLMGLMLSMGGAAGVVLLAETRDTSFHTVDDVRTFTSVPVLISVPPIFTLADARRRRLQLSLAALATALGAAGIIAASSYLARSNDLLVRLLTPGRF